MLHQKAIIASDLQVLRGIYYLLQRHISRFNHWSKHTLTNAMC